MVIYRDQWHYRLYIWSRKLLFHFRNRDRYFDPFQGNPNLCPYVRTLVIWMPLVVLLHVAVLVELCYVCIIIPFSWMERLPADEDMFSGLLPSLITVAVSVSIVVCAIVVIVGAILAIKGYVSVRRARVAEADDRTGFLGVLAAYWQAVHDKVCPQIQIKGA